MWKGRFDKNATALLEQYGESISYDWRLYKHDIAGSLAHARAQKQAGLLTDEEFLAIQEGLWSIEKDIADGKFTFSTKLEDIHMHIESALTERIGPPGAKLHTARSRNDQVATDTRLYCRQSSLLLIKKITHLQKSLLEQSAHHTETIIPGYTHLQRAQPVTLAHHLLAYVEMLQRDKERLIDGLKRINISPLGSGALAGSTIALNRKDIADELGFDSVSTNSMDAISDRDYVAELLFGIALCGTHLSRLSEDFILWCSAEFGFMTLSDAHSTGSSLMPQKKNPDICELTRGKTGRLYGNLITLLTALKGLPLTYNRDLQEDKEPLFDSIDTLILALDINAEMVQAAHFCIEKCEEAASDPFLLATDLADYLVKRGVPFRQAHHLVGKAVAHSLLTKTPLHLLDFPSLSPEFGEDARDVFSLKKALLLRQTEGSPNPQHAQQSIECWKKRFISEEKTLSS